ncbi:hypothetical protein CSV61_12910 [Sporosarcina sp. P3]|uniref:DUF2642 domain-containing protein n=1 Tax=Sporosarcina sp. P3 TaxID=2048245 RepID=UPI000C16DF34|nr:DUF2642 domain-containing protein [Sporosarcina sp. P3]PID20879.1 hypothetical protein CSV61_12910 [Sporosarcina sp. P3]
MIMYGFYYAYPQVMTASPMQSQSGHQEHKRHPIAQPDYVNQSPANYTTIHPTDKIPQPNRYVTRVEPVFLDHLSRHQGLDITVQTTAKEVKGKLAAVAIDHIELKLSDTKSLHVRLDQIVYFEGLSLGS